MIQNLDNGLRYTPAMLAPVDVVVLLKICAKRGQAWTQMDLAHELYMSQSSVNRAMKACQALNLYSPKRKTVNAKNLEDALVHGARFFLAPERGGETRGMPTSWAAPPLHDRFAASNEAIPVWPDPQGEARGVALQPLHPSVPKAARQDSLLYELLALVDALREGRPRESKLAAKELHQRLNIR